MTPRSAAEIRQAIESTLAEKGINYERTMAGGLFASFYGAADPGSLAEVFEQAQIPCERLRGGISVSPYQIDQLARQGWTPS